MATPAQQTQPESEAFARALDAPPAGSGPWTLDRSFRYCERLARSHYENFPVGSALVPRRLRKYFYAIYAFARTADDFADEGYGGRVSEAERLCLLRRWRDLLRESGEGRAAHPIFVALAETRARFNLSTELFEDLLSAFEQDVRVRRYETFSELVDYCRRSANPVGRLILSLFGHTGGQLLSWSDSICTALQLTNHWQDVAVDLQKDRIYLPAEDMRAFGVSEADLRRGEVTPALRHLMAFEVARARALFAGGKPLCLAVGGRLGLELRAVWLGGRRILDLIEAGGYDVFNRRPVVTSADKLRILLSAFNKERFGRN
jgi:squalene synthase HpnC